MWACNTGLDCEDCVGGCEKNLVWEDVPLSGFLCLCGELLLRNENMCPSCAEDFDNVFITFLFFRAVNNLLDERR